MSPRLVWVSVVVVGACALVGCSDASGSGAGTTASTTTLPMPGPGTPLADGLVVPKGAALLGRVFPRDGGWQAVLELRAHGAAPFRAVVQQAEAADFSTNEGCPWPECTLTRGARRIKLEQVDGGCGSVRPVSHLAITTENTSGSALSHFTERPLVESPAARPKRGTLLNPNGWHAAPVRLEAGSRLVGTPMASCETNARHRSVVVLDRPTPDVVSAYVRQWRAQAGPTSTPDAMAIAVESGHRLTVGGVDEAGGDGWTIHVIEEDGVPTYGLIESATDP